MKQQDKSKVGIEAGLYKLGTDRLAEIWGCCSSEAGRRVSGERGVKIAELCRALDEAGVRVIPPHADVQLVDREEYRAMKILARRSAIFADDQDEE
jgi:hypothetical protein